MHGEYEDSMVVVRYWPSVIMIRLLLQCSWSCKCLHNDWNHSFMAMGMILWKSKPCPSSQFSYNTLYKTETWSDKMYHLRWGQRSELMPQNCPSLMDELMYPLGWGQSGASFQLVNWVSQADSAAGKADHLPLVSTPESAARTHICTGSSFRLPHPNAQPEPICVPAHRSGSQTKIGIQNIVRGTPHELAARTYLYSGCSFRGTHPNQQPDHIYVLAVRSEEPTRIGSQIIFMFWLFIQGNPPELAARSHLCSGCSFGGTHPNRQPDHIYVLAVHSGKPTQIGSQITFMFWLFVRANPPKSAARSYLCSGCSFGRTHWNRQPDHIYVLAVRLGEPTRIGSQNINRFGLVASVGIVELPPWPFIYIYNKTH
jgi:hypothetical protein